VQPVVVVKVSAGHDNGGGRARQIQMFLGSFQERYSEVAIAVPRRCPGRLGSISGKVSEVSRQPGSG
jgi:hypothetical protein